MRGPPQAGRPPLQGHPGVSSPAVGPSLQGHPGVSRSLPSLVSQYPWCSWCPKVCPPPHPALPGRLVDEPSRSATAPNETYKWTCDKIIKSCYFSPDPVLLNTLKILSPSFSPQTWVLQALCACFK